MRNTITNNSWNTIEWGLGFLRVNNFPIDPSCTFETLEEFQAYLEGNDTDKPYLGLLVAVKEADKYHVYVVQEYDGSIWTARLLNGEEINDLYELITLLRADVETDLSDLENSLKGEGLTLNYDSLAKILDIIIRHKVAADQSFKNLLTELNDTQNGVGLSLDGSYSPDKMTNYLKNATSVMNALRILDNIIGKLKYLFLESSSAYIEAIEDETSITLIPHVKIAEGSDIKIPTEGGLYINVDTQYNNGILKLLVNGKVKETHDIGLSGIVEDAYYDQATEKIVIIFKLYGDTVQRVEIPAKHLIEEWTINNKNHTVELTKTRVVDGPGTLSADVNLNKDQKNLIKSTSTGLLVKTATGIESNYTSKDYKGNPYYATDSKKILLDGVDYGGIKRSEMGQPNGVASLDEEGKISVSQLPENVKDVLEYSNYASFPESGSKGKLYIAKDTNKIYSWNGTSYSELANDIINIGHFDTIDEMSNEAAKSEIAGDKTKPILMFAIGANDTPGFILQTYTPDNYSTTQYLYYNNIVKVRSIAGVGDESSNIDASVWEITAPQKIKYDKNTRTLYLEDYERHKLADKVVLPIADGETTGLMSQDTYNKLGTLLDSIGANITIGDNVSIYDNVSIGTGVNIADNATLGDRVTIGTAGGRPVDIQAGVVIGTYGSEQVDTVVISTNVAIGKNVTIGTGINGNVAAAGVHISDNVRIDTNVHINSNSTIGSIVTIGSNTTIGSDTSIGTGVLIGNGVKIPNEVTISTSIGIDAEGKVWIGTNNPQNIVVFKPDLTGLNNDVTNLQSDVNTLETNLNTLLNANPDETINNFNEIVNFLDGIQDTETLDGIVAGISSQINTKADIDDLSNVKAEEVVDSTTLENFDTLTREQLKKDLFNDQWTAWGGTIANGQYAKFGVAMNYDKAVRVYGMHEFIDKVTGKGAVFNAETEYFELNGLTDLTKEDMELIDAEWVFRQTGPVGSKQLYSRTNYRMSSAHGIMSLYNFYAGNLEVLDIPLTLPNTFAGWLSSPHNNLKKIIGSFDMSYFNSSANMSNGLNCPNLTDIKFSRVHVGLNIPNLKSISYDSLQFLVANASNTAAITITVHADVYAKLTGDTTNAAAAALTPEEAAQWQALVTTAADKQISFALPA